MQTIIKELMAAVSDLEIWNDNHNTIEAACRYGFTMREMEAIIAIANFHGLTFQIESEPCGDFGDEGTAVTIYLQRVQK